MRKVKVINTGKRVRDRLGSRFLSKEEKIMEVTSREYLTLKAVKDFKVEIVKENVEEETQEKDAEQDETEEQTEDDSEESMQAEQNIQQLQETINDSNIETVLDMVENNEVDVDQAIAYETVGKNRSTLIDKLEEMKKGE